MRPDEGTALAGRSADVPIQPGLAPLHLFGRKKLADLAVLDTDLFETGPAAWLEAGVDFTVVGGKIVYHGGASAREGRREP